ncbi:MAG: Spy/CpxP family protein refolding chaperone [Cyclobacteriaceae bacterium]
MNLRSKMSIFTLVGAIMLVPMFSFSQGPQSPERHKGEEGRQNTERRKDVLDLTDAQRDQAKDIRMSAASEILPIRNQINEIRAKLETLQTAKEVDMKLINKNIDEMAGLDAEIQKIRARSHQDFRAMLTDEQRIIFDTKASMKRGGPGDRNHKNRPAGRRP